MGPNSVGQGGPNQGQVPQHHRSIHSSLSTIPEGVEGKTMINVIPPSGVLTNANFFQLFMMVSIFIGMNITYFVFITP